MLCFAFVLFIRFGLVDILAHVVAIVNGGGKQTFV